MRFWKDFGTFIARGNVLDLAVGVIIGTAFATITKSLTDDLIMPVIGWAFGGVDFSGWFIRLGPVPANYHGSLTSYAALKEAGVPLIGYGQFLSVVINFLILAFAVFVLVRYVQRAVRLIEEKAAIGAADASAEAAPEPAPETAEVQLLREIRDALRTRGESGAGPAA